MSGRINSLNNGYVGSSAEIPTCSVALGVVTPRKQYIRALEIDQWERPDYWLPLPTVSETEQKIVGLYPIFKGASGATGASADSNWITFTIVGATYVVDWGVTTAARPNGVTTAHSSNTAALFQYNWNDVPPTTETPQGHRQAIVQIYPQVAGTTFTQLIFNRAFVLSGFSFSANTASLWLDLKVSARAAIACFANLRLLKKIEFIGPLQNVNSNQIDNTGLLGNCVSLERIVGTRWTENITDGLRLLNNCYSLRTFPLIDTRKMTTQFAMFDGCLSLNHFPCIDTSKVVSFSYLLRFARNLVEIPFLNTSSGTNFSVFLQNTSALESIPPFDTRNATDTSNMLDGSGIKKMPWIDMSKVTNAGAMFQSCSRLKELPLLNTGNVRNFNNFINSAFTLEELPPIDTSKGQAFFGFAQNATCLSRLPGLSFAGVTGHPSQWLGNSQPVFYNMLYRTRKLLQVPEWDFSHINHGPTSAVGTGATGPFQFMFGDDVQTGVRVMGIKGFRRSLTLQNMVLSPTELNRIFTNLEGVTAVGGATINITGVWGATASAAFGRTADRTIATNKGWTVVG